jgi:hypothetical protein
MGGFADYLGEASVRPRTGIPPDRGTPALPGDPGASERLSDSPEGRFLAGLSPAARAITLRNLAKAHRDPRRVTQDELDDYDDETKWDWLRQVCTAEAQDKEQSAAAAAQTRMEGHH